MSDTRLQLSGRSREFLGLSWPPGLRLTGRRQDIEGPVQNIQNIGISQILWDTRPACHLPCDFYPDNGDTQRNLDTGNSVPT